jgi:hypothetical protein
MLLLLGEVGQGHATLLPAFHVPHWRPRAPISAGLSHSKNKGGKKHLHCWRVHDFGDCNAMILDG